MSQTRQQRFYDANGHRRFDMAGGSWDFKHGHRLPNHSHPEAQLLFASQGVMTLETAAGLWVVPPLRAVWIPPKTPHAVTMSGKVSMRTLYLAPVLCRSLPNQCLVINISALLRELILHVCTFPRLHKRTLSHRRIIELILDQLKAVKAIPMQLPHPSDIRARKLVDKLRANPADVRPLAALSAECGASQRTMQRLFTAESGMSFSRWRQRARLIHALQSLAAGESVTTAALEAGYNSTSAFISMFRKQLGATPTRYLAAQDEQPGR